MPLKKMIPLMVFVALAIAFMVGLQLKPQEISSVMTGRSVPSFSLPPLEPGTPRLDHESLIRTPGVVVVNFYASWCLPCRVEHPQLMALAQVPGVTMIGIAYKDKPENARGFLLRLGNPYAHVAIDQPGRVAIDWGVYGVPETYILKDGIIRYKHVGPIHEHEVADKIMPVLRELMS